MKRHLLWIWIFLITITCSKDKTNPCTPSSTGEGLCIYPAVLSSTHQAGVDEIDVNLAEISGKPIVSYGEILSYDTAAHVIRLSIPRDSLTLFGRFHTPFLVTLDSVKIYGGWFFANFASSICNSVVIIADDFTVIEPNSIRISLGYPSERFYTGTDPRANPAIIRRLIQDGKIK
jgi:hypothetical protein